MKKTARFLCSSCNLVQTKWFGRCPQCGQWNTAVEYSDPERAQKKGSVLRLSDIQSSAAEFIKTNIRELDRVLEGGLVRGSSVLCGGEPGIGKSTLMLQLSASTGTKVLYTSGEEAASRIRQRADRLRVAEDAMFVSVETNLEHIVSSCAELKPDVLIVDSIQTIRSGELSSIAGSVSQVRHCTQVLIEMARSFSIALILVAHITKEGDIAGPKILEHLVDTVLFFDKGDLELRFLRATKNRFGTVDEVGLFTMGREGLTPVQNPSQFFLVQRKESAPSGVVTVPVYEGSRVFMVEIQSLIVPAPAPTSRIYSDRIDVRRISRIAAVLEKYLKVPLASQDIYVNVAGGIGIQDVGVDAGLALALYSACLEVPAAPTLTAFGEISLAGEIRPASFAKQRIRTAKEMGFTRCVAPESTKPHSPTVSTLEELIRIVFQDSPSR